MKDEAKRLAKKVAIVHAAAISRVSVIWKTRVEDWDSVQAVNLRGAFFPFSSLHPAAAPECGRPNCADSVHLWLPRKIQHILETGRQLS